MAKHKPMPIPDALRSAIKASGLTHYAVGKLADVSVSVVDRFMSGERDIRLETAAKIAAALGLELR
jgi:transcriptional regulator with XRE-family HTH domain